MLPRHSTAHLLARRVVAVAALAALALASAACVPAAAAGTLPATLTMQTVGSSPVAFQNGIPVPTFDPQPRATIDLSGMWRVERTVFDSDLTLTDRSQSLARIEADAGGRQVAAYDDSWWPEVAVPGSTNLPPDRGTASAWYRRHFDVPAAWAGHAFTLKFGAANYIADVWLNGQYLGYHEGGFTPFAFDVSRALLPGRENVLAVRVDAPEWGTREDIVPWGLADWWDYGGLTQPVWIEASSSVLIDRTDVVPHLDGADVTIELEQRAVPGRPSAGAISDVVVEILPTVLDEDALGSDIQSTAAGDASQLDAWSLIPQGVVPLGRTEMSNVQVPPSGVAVVRASFAMARAKVWTVSRPALYVVRVTLITTAGEIDQMYESFGLRHIAVDPSAPRLLLNGQPIAFSGASVHAESILSPLDSALSRSPGTGMLTLERAPSTATSSAKPSPSPTASPAASPAASPGASAAASPGDSSAGVAAPDAPSLPPGTLAVPLTNLRQAYAQLAEAGAVHATLVRTAHQPGVPALLTLADRLGVAVWEEIPLYHFTPRTFQIALGRGIPQQMLREMALRDMNRPSVLFYGLANESTGDGQRTDAMTTLRDVARQIDGTRLTGQAAYGFDPTDPTSDPLDVAGFTFYYGVFYGKDAAEDTRQALAAAHARYPTKPIMVLEFGRWADIPDGPWVQRQVLQSTQRAISDRYDTQTSGYVGASVWWSLDDSFTMRPGIEVERFGLFDPAGQPRLAGKAAAALFDAAPVGPADAALPAVGGDVAVAVARPVDDPGAALRLGGYLGYGLLVVIGTLGGSLAVLLVAGRASSRRTA